MHTWSPIATTFPHSSQRRFGSSRSQRWRTAATTPRIGTANPMRNQIANELPLILPIVPADRPQKNITTKEGATTGPRASEQPVEGPDHGEDREHRDHDPEDERRDADDHLEQDPARDEQDH